MLHQRGVAIIVAEHRLADVADLATRLIVFQDGRVVADGAPWTVLACDVSKWGLEAPPWVRLARAAGIDATPLTLNEALELALPNGSVVPASPGDIPATPPVIAWEDVSFAHGDRTVLSRACLAAGAGEIIGILGAMALAKRRCSNWATDCFVHNTERFAFRGRQLDDVRSGRLRAASGWLCSIRGICSSHRQSRTNWKRDRAHSSGMIAPGSAT